MERNLGSTVAVSAANAQPGDAITASGDSAISGDSVTVTFDGTLVGSAVADVYGSFSITFMVPGGRGGWRARACGPGNW